MSFAALNVRREATANETHFNTILAWVSCAGEDFPVCLFHNDYQSKGGLMKKIIQIINIAAIILMVIGIVFGTWRDLESQKYSNRGLPPPGNQCFYDQVENFLGGIFSLWVGITLTFKPSGLAKFFGKDQSYTEIAFIRIWGLIWLIMGIYSFWNIGTSNLYYCHAL
jgi:hypothetical protein